MPAKVKDSLTNLTVTPLLVRLPSSSGHPICTDLVSVGEDVHYEFVKEKVPPEYRQEAGRLVLESGRPIGHVAKEIGVAEGLLGKWVKLERERLGSADGRCDADIRAENARLRRKLAEVKMDDEFLPKATAFFMASKRDRKNFR